MRDIPASYVSLPEGIYEMIFFWPVWIHPWTFFYKTKYSVRNHSWITRITPWKMNGWNLQITHLERKMIFQTSMIMFHVNLPGVHSLKLTFSHLNIVIECQLFRSEFTILALFGPFTRKPPTFLIAVPSFCTREWSVLFFRDSLCQCHMTAYIWLNYNRKSIIIWFDLFPSISDHQDVYLF